MRTAEDEAEVSEMLKADEDALRAIRAADTALQERWPEGESPRSWEGVKWSGDRVQVLNLNNSGLEVLAPQIGQLTALTRLLLVDCMQLKELPPEIGQLTALIVLNLYGCNQLKELPPQFGQLLALTTLDLRKCEQLTLAPDAEVRQPAPTIVAAYAPLLIVAPHKDAPGELHAFLLDNKLVVPAFFKAILTDAAHATWLGEAVTATPELAKLTAADGRRAIDVAVPACKQAMQAALFLLGRFDVDDGKLLHRSATAAVAAADDHGDPEARPVPRVALKAMREVDQVRAELEGRAGLDRQYVIAIKAVYADEEAVDAGEWGTLESAAAGLQGVELQRVAGLSRSIRAHLFKPGARQTKQAGGLVRQPTLSSLPPQYCFVLVLELADRSLLQTINHDQIAGKDWPAIRHIASDLGSALDHVHAKGGIHADFKPLNAVGERDTWKIIDFDVFCKVGEPFGNKVPSSGYCPPEMAKVLLAATDQDTGEVNTSLLEGYLASEAYDLWSFGVVLYHLCFSTPLWKTDINDNVDLEGLQLLASVADEPLRLALNKALNNGVRKNASVDLKTATVLLRKLLEPDPTKRLKHFENFDRPMEAVLEEPFFQGQSLDGATLEQMRQQMKEQNELLGQQMAEQNELLKKEYELLKKEHELLKKVDGKIDQVLEKLNANFKMLSTLLKGVDSVAPKLICFLPVSAVQEDSSNKNRWWRKALHPKDWLNQKVLVFFFDPIQLKLAATNPDAEGKAQGFEITFPKEWVVKAMPYVKLGLAVLKAAAIAGRLSGFPVPDVAGVIGGWMGEQLEVLDGLKEEAMESLSRQTKDPKLARTLLDKVDDYAANVASSALESVAPVSGEPLDERVAEPLQKSVEELNELLGEGWQQKSGLKFTTATDGTSEWVRPEDVERFKRDGAALLGKEAQVNEGAISQLGAMHQQLTESQTENEKLKQDLIDAEKLKQDLIDVKPKAGCTSCCVLS